jgi:hypothetical protein
MASFLAPPSCKVIWTATSKTKKPSEGIEGIEGKWDMEARGIAFLIIVDSGDKQVSSSTVVGGK